MLSIKLFIHRLRLKEKLCYIVILLSGIFAFFSGLGPFLSLQTATGVTKVFTGYGFLWANEVGNFAPFAALGIIYNGLILLLALWAILKAKPQNDSSFFWACTVVFCSGFLSFGLILNYYAINFSLFLTNGYQTHVLWAGIIYDLALWLGWPAFFYLHHHGYGQQAAAPNFGTGLDDESVKR